MAAAGSRSVIPRATSSTSCPGRRSAPEPPPDSSTRHIAAQSMRHQPPNQSPAHDPRQKRSGGAYHRRVGLWPEPNWSSCRARCAVGVPAGTGDDPYRHRAEHALHAGTHMANSHRVYLVVPQEPCHTGVMGTFGPLVVQRSPGNGELLPVADLLIGHVGDRDPVGSSPARVDLAIICDWHAYPHVESLLAGARKFWAPLGSPFSIKPDATACSGPLA